MATKAFPMSLYLILLALAMIQPSAAAAATRTVCFHLEFRDERYDCPISTELGVLRACNISLIYNTYSTPVGMEYELWDKDGTDPANDDYIADFRILGEGERCATFEWDTISGGEDDPDVYLVSQNEVRASPGGAKIDAYTSSNSPWLDLTWRESAVATNCTTAGGSACDIPGTMVYSTDPETNLGLMIQTLDSAQRALVAFDGAINNTAQVIRLRMNDATYCPNWFCANGPDDIYMDAEWENGKASPHEIGHLLQLREYNGQSDLVLDCSAGTGGPADHVLDEYEYDSCAMVEGWADYVSIVSWWEPNIGLTLTPSVLGYDMEEPNPWGSSCYTASGMSLQVTKGFWDLDDNANENNAGEATGDDDASSSTIALLNHWDNFPDGTANRQDEEAGINGGNVYDYDYNGPLNATQFEAFIDHNCLGDQAP